MAYLSKAYTQFFKDLSKNNHRDWFQANKKTYDNEVKKPFEALVQDLIDTMSKYDKDVTITPKEALFRINKDVRFSKDKSPYKLHMGAIIGKDGRKGMDKPGLYFEIGATEIGIAGGMHMLDKDQLQSIRESIAKDPTAFEKLIKDKNFVKVCGELQGESNKIVPKEFKEVFAKHPVIARKQFYYFKKYDDEKLVSSDDLAAFIYSHFEAGIPLHEYLVKVLP